jgi:fatty acid amide hydrolase
MEGDHCPSQTVSTPSDLLNQSATQMAQSIRDGEVTSRELVDAHIARIEEVNPLINAMALPRCDEARAEADAVDQMRQGGQDLGPLAGVPITIKEQFLVKGLPTSIGLPQKAKEPRPEDGPMVARLRAAGAVILGKTNVVQLLAAWETDNPIYGRTLNPWNLDRTPGGSSGGEAALIAARGSPLGLGGDLGGSIRIPAHFCGLYGLKSTAWRLPLSDTPSDLFPPGETNVVPQVGPLSRTVEDLRLAMQVMLDGDLTVDGCPPVPWNDGRDLSMKGLRVGLCEDDGHIAASPAIRRAVRKAGDILAEQGATLVPFSMPNAERLMQTFVAIVSSDGGANFKRLLQGAPPHQLLKGMIAGAGAPAFMRPMIAKIFAMRRQGRLAALVPKMGARSAQSYLSLIGDLLQARVDFKAAMDAAAIDVLVLPPYAVPAPTHGSTETLLDAASYALAFSASGNPAGVAPITRVQPGEESDRPERDDLVDLTAAKVEAGSAGLPVGVQVVARHWREDLVLSTMHALEVGLRGDPDFPKGPGY